MMTSIELQQTLLRLGLSQTESAQLLDVAPRTVRRWVEGEKIPGSVEQVFRAWLRLHEKGLAWRPDSASILEDHQDQIARHRDHTVALSDMLARVDARGGPRLPWKVDLERSRAVLGAMEVSFYRLASGSFWLGTYTRKDGDPDVQRDQEFIEDAAYCISKEIAVRPVTLVYQDRPWRNGIMNQEHKPFPSKEAALEYACAAMGTATFHDPFIMAPDSIEPVMAKHDLRRECERRVNAASALKNVANYILHNSTLSVRSGPRMLTSDQAAQKKQEIEDLAEQIASLAEQAVHGLASYRQFEPILGDLHKLGFFPETALVSAVARALVA